MKRLQSLFTWLDVIEIHGDVSFLIRALLFVIESSGVHQFVKNNRRINASIVETHFLWSTYMPFLRPTTANTFENFSFTTKSIHSIFQVTQFLPRIISPSIFGFSAPYDLEVILLGFAGHETNASLFVVDRHSRSDYLSLFSR